MEHTIVPYESEIFYHPLGLRIWELRHHFVDDLLHNFGVTKAIDIGCNTGKFLGRLTQHPEYDLLACMDINQEALKIAKRNTKPDFYHYLDNERQKPLKLQVYQGSVLEKYPEIKNLNLEAITMIELIEHLQPEWVPKLGEAIFGYYNPQYVVITTPNSDFNEHFVNLSDTWKKGQFRDPDHKFEWSQKEFSTFCDEICQQYKYTVEYTGVGHPKTGDKSLGYSSQIAVFTRQNDEEQDNNNNVYETHQREEAKEDTNNSKQNPIFPEEEKEETIEFPLKLLQEYDFPYKRPLTLKERLNNFPYELYKAFDFLNRRSKEQVNGEYSDFTSLKDLTEMSSIQKLLKDEEKTIQYFIKNSSFTEYKIIYHQSNKDFIKMEQRITTSEEEEEEKFDSDYEQIPPEESKLANSQSKNDFDENENDCSWLGKRSQSKKGWSDVEKNGSQLHSDFDSVVGE